MPSAGPNCSFTTHSVLWLCNPQRWMAHLACLHSLLNKDVCPTQATHSDPPREELSLFVLKAPQDS